MINKILAAPLILLIKLYQAGISPFLGTRCRHIPTCSTYLMDAIKIHGILKGNWLGLKRILRCNPWGTVGVDPVPPKKNSKSN